MRLLLARIINAIERIHDPISWALRQRIGLAPVTLHGYRSYGTRERVFANGRALAGWRVQASTPNDSLWRNAVNTLGRFHTHELPYVRVRARFPHGRGYHGA